jgi:MtN3 and saliva related transmembrane protein
MIWSIIGMCAAALTMFSFVPQIFKVFKTKSCHDVSLVMLIQLSAGVSLWIAYGIYRRDPIIIIANIATLVSMVILISLYFAYGRTGPSSSRH